MSDTAQAKAARARGLVALAGALFAVYAFLVVMAYYEPITGDGWFVSSEIARRETTLPVVIRWMEFNHLRRNPRLGQLFTFFTYIPPLHVLVTPLVELLLIVLVFMHATGRRPRATVRDATLLLCATAFCWLATPAPGHAYFYRPITTNYIYSLVLVLLYFLPFRFGVRAARPIWSGALACVMFVAGFAVGMLNEHTGPAVILAALAFAALAWRRRAFLDLTWMASATVGLALGYRYLFFAPGLGRRAGHVSHSVLQTVLLRGFVGNLELLGAFVVHVAPLLLALLVLAIAAGGRRVLRDTLSTQPSRSRLIGMAVYVLLGLLVLGISLASPRSHYRLAMAPALFLVIAALGVVDLFWDLPRVRKVGATGALAVHLVFAAVFLQLYHELHRDDLRRISLAEHTRPDQVLYVPAMNRKSSPLFYGDTLPSERQHRQRMAEMYHIAEVRIGKAHRERADPAKKKSKHKKAGRKKPGHKKSPPPD